MASFGAGWGVVLGSLVGPFGGIPLNELLSKDPPHELLLKNPLKELLVKDVLKELLDVSPLS